MMVGQGENRFVDRGTGTVDKSSSFRHTTMPRRKVSKKELREDEKGRGKEKKRKRYAERGCTRIREDEGGGERERKRRGIKWFQHRHALGVLNRCCCAETVKRAATPFWNRLLAASTRPKRFVLRVYVCEREACARSVSVCKRAARFDCTAKRGRSGRGGYFETSRETKREFHPEVMRGQNCTAFLILWYGCPLLPARTWPRLVVVVALHSV